MKRIVRHTFKEKSVEKKVFIIQSFLSISLSDNIAQRMRNLLKKWINYHDKKSFPINMYHLKRIYEIWQKKKK